MADERQCNETKCDGNCNGCAQAAEGKTSMLKPLNIHSSIRKVIGVVSGKGGVGKSMVTGLLAARMAQAGYHVGILDADITGPSIPKMFGVGGSAMSDGEFLYPAETPGGLKIMSVNLLLETPETPVIWRGPVIAGAVQQFWTDVVWGDLDYLFIDMPPGTGDVPLTVFQSIPVDGVVIVTSPQDLVSMIVKKAYHMAQQMGIPVLGLVENMSYVACPDCGKKIFVFGESRVAQVAEELGVPLLAQMPLDPQLAALADAGEMEQLEADYLSNAKELLQ